MKVIEIFECGVCHKIWPSKDYAEKCEELHLQPTGIVDVSFARTSGYVDVYADEMEPEADYPETIQVKFENGVTRTYFSRRVR